jgi:UDP-glucose 4-epimerase
VVDRLATICGKRPVFIQGDVRDADLLDSIFAEHEIGTVMNLTGFKAVGGSTKKPLYYYDNNVIGTLQLVSAMSRSRAKSLLFSSSAVVYGDPISIPIRESFPRSAINTCGRSKMFVENLLDDLHKADDQWRIARLRYLNPVDAHVPGLIGEAPQGTPNNLMPCVARVAARHREFLNIWGNDYPTPDVNGVRDFIHVCDLAEGHSAALDYLERKAGMLTINLGTGKGYFVLEIVKAFEKASGRSVPFKFGARRTGDCAKSWADVTLAKR